MRRPRGEGERRRGRREGESGGREGRGERREGEGERREGEGVESNESKGRTKQASTNAIQENETLAKKSRRMPIATKTTISNDLEDAENAENNGEEDRKLVNEGSEEKGREGKRRGEGKRK